ncbi:MAG: penicillin acylase family protein [Caldisphaeraceae archaeon]|nr:penicillin acylase family protein [Caldisphaeraceae archaeon]
MVKSKTSYVLIGIFLFIIIFLSIFGMSFTFLSPSRKSIWLYQYKIKNQTIHLKGLKNKVEVIIDSNGVAHIYAKDKYDAFYAEGYYTASMRLFQLELFGLTGMGNLSSWFGKKAINMDIKAHEIGFPQNANLSLQFVKAHYPSLYEDLVAYSNGINAYIAQAEKSHELPPIFYLAKIKPYKWSPLYSLAWGEVMAYSLTSGFCEELELSLIYPRLGFNLTKTLMPYYPYFINGSITAMPGNGTVNSLNLESFNISPTYFWSLNFYSQWATGISNATLIKARPLILSALRGICEDPPLGFIDLGSNEWEVTGNYSATGYPIIANDPHLTLYDPSLWLPIQLSAPGINVTGWELVGEPGILIGHTKYTAWGLTTPMGASSDAYLEKINMNNKSFLFNGKWYPMKAYRFDLMGKEYTLYYTNNGPLVAYNSTLGLGISLYWPAEFHPFLTLVAEMLFDNSTNFSQLIRAAEYWVIPPQNIGMVSRNHAGYITAGLYPLINIALPNNKTIRVIGARLILNGSSGKYEPVGFVPFKYLPHAFNPKRGYIFAPNQPTAYIDYPFPFVGGYWASGARALTIYRFLKAHKNITIDQMEELQGNVTDAWASVLNPVFVSCLSGQSLNGIESEGIKKLSEWNFTFYQNEVAPTIFTYTKFYLLNDTLGSILSSHGLSNYTELFYAGYNLLVNDLAYLGTHNETSPLFNGSFCNAVQSAYVKAISYLDSKLGSNISQWNWGRVHKLLLVNPAGITSLNYGPLPLWGDGFTPSAAYFSFNGTAYMPLITSEGPSLRMVSSPGLGEFFGVFPGGPSENFYSNLTQLNYWLHFKYFQLGRVSKPVIVWVLLPGGK